jgi:rubrerythrin
MEERKEVKAFKVAMICERCNEGEMKYTGITFSTDPPKYQHQCPVCGYKKSYTKIYPNVEYEVVKPIDEEPLNEE